MAVAQVLSRAQLGLEALLVQIEAHLGAGLPGFSIVGLPAPVVRESRERVRSALLNSGYEFPAGRITVNLAPVELAKEGGRYDLPVALALLLASGQLAIPGSAVRECYGELGLDGQLRPVRGLLLAAAHAGRAGHELILPLPNLDEVRLAGATRACGFTDLRGACAYLEGRESAAQAPGAASDARPLGVNTVTQKLQYELLNAIKGQWRSKRALCIAGAGAHSLLMVGPPGSGKSLLAARLRDLLPPLAEAEAMEVAGIASISGSGFDPARWRQRPFRAPHHAASANAIVGGGTRLQPGEISLAHRGVLFMDELPEFDHRVLEALREPLESGTVTLARANERLRLPAEFQLVAAMNPCPCGFLGDPGSACRCGPRRVRRYRERLSGPLLDRIDLHLEVPRVDLAELRGPAPAGEPDGAAIASAIAAARIRQAQRQSCCNARLGHADLEAHCPLEADAALLLERVGNRLRLSARGYHRLLKVARTIADLEGADTIGAAHVGEAASFRPAAAPGEEGLSGGATGRSGPGNPRPT